MTAFHATAVDHKALRAYRLGRVREQLRRRDYGGILLYDPLNIRYATDTSNMQVWTLHNAVRYAFIPTEGPITLFDFHGCGHLSAHIETVDEVRPATGWFYFGAGDEAAVRVQSWADELLELIKQHCGTNNRIAVDKLDPLGVWALEERQIDIQDGQQVMEIAREVKNHLELAAMKESIAACQEGMRRMRAALEPGITENKLWSILHQTNIEMGGEWIETRLLTSGQRTNPWFQECSNRVIQKGDIVSFDTDLIGPNGYCSDISRTWRCGGGKPSDEQRRLYAVAREQIRFNIDLLRPGMTYKEFAEKSFQLPDEFVANRYSVVFHGVGLCDEYPGVVYARDWDHGGYDGVIQENMTVCIESLVGTEGGKECIKLEEQVHVTASGAKQLSTYPFEEDWL